MGEKGLCFEQNKVLDDEVELCGTVHRVKARGLGVLRAFCVI